MDAYMLPKLSSQGVFNHAILFVLSVLTLQTIRVLYDRRRNPLRLPHPPGPRGYPLIGNLLDVPTSQQWRTYTDWAKTYGDIFSLNVLGQRIVLLSSLEVVQDLLEKRSANYSDRPRMPMLMELMDFGFVFALIPYGHSWRKQRRMFDEHFRANAVQKYESTQAREAKAYLGKLLQTPRRFGSHIRENLGVVIMNIVYGITPQGPDDPFIRNVEESLVGFNAAAIPGSFLVDTIPILKYVPSCFPGAGFKKKAAHWARVNRDALELPFEHVVTEMKKGTAGPSIAAELISELQAHAGNPKQLDDEVTLIKNVTAVAYMGGTDTVVSAMQIFFLAMALHPEAQQKAQAELDKIVGPNRHPEFCDRAALPYLNALIKETLRWQLAAPLGIPHVATEDDVYGGYFIRKGTILMGNAWAILQDERIFKDPGTFRPERFLKDGQLDPDVLQPEECAFGFGRRICAGRYFADNAIFILVASTLHAFRITPALDDKGNAIPISQEMTSGLLSYPEPFEIDIKPRSASAEALVANSSCIDRA